MLCMLFIALAFSWMQEKALQAQEKALQALQAGGIATTTRSLSLKILPPQYSAAENSTVYEIEIRLPQPTVRIALKEKAYLRIIELANFRRTKAGGWVEYADLHEPGSDNTLARADYKEIAIAIRDSVVALLLQEDEDKHTRRIRAEPQNIEMDMEAIRINTENSGLALRRHLFPPPLGRAQAAGTDHPPG